MYFNLLGGRRAGLGWERGGAGGGGRGAQEERGVQREDPLQAGVWFHHARAESYGKLPTVL